MQNIISFGGTGIVSLHKTREGRFLGSVIDTLPHFASFAEVTPRIAAAAADPDSWSRCLLPTFASAASAWSSITSLPTFHDLRNEGPLERKAYLRLTKPSVDADNELRMPDITAVLALAGQHSQQTFTHVINHQLYIDLVNDKSLDDRVRIRARQATLEGAGLFQTAVPDKSGQLDLSDRDYLTNFWYRYGLTQRFLVDKTCVMKCKECGPGTGTLPPWFKDGTHMLHCTTCAGVYGRHQALLTCVEDFERSKHEGTICTRAPKDIGNHMHDSGQLDTVIWNPYANVEKIGVDATVVAPLAPSHATSGDADAPPTAFIERIDKKKRARHEASCKANNMEYMSAIFTVEGGVGGDYLYKSVKPHFQERRARARAGLSDESPWEVDRCYRRLLTRWSVVIARWNGALMSRAISTSAPSTRDDGIHHNMDDALSVSPSEVSDEHDYEEDEEGHDDLEPAPESSPPQHSPNILESILEGVEEEALALQELDGASNTVGAPARRRRRGPRKSKRALRGVRFAGWYGEGATPIGDLPAP